MATIGLHQQRRAMTSHSAGSMLRAAMPAHAIDTAAAWIGAEQVKWGD